MSLGARVINADKESLKHWMLGGSFVMGLGSKRCHKDTWSVE